MTSVARCAVFPRKGACFEIAVRVKFPVCGYAGFYACFKHVMRFFVLVFAFEEIVVILTGKMCYCVGP